MEEQKVNSQKCQRCKVNYTLDNFDLKRNGNILKTCKRCLKKTRENYCNHNRRRNNCKDCGGSSICEHNRERSKCKDCGGSSICEHNRIKSICKDCGGASICEHNKRRANCIDCGGSAICEHNRYRSKCKECNDPIPITIKEMICHSKSSDKKYNRYDQTNFIDYCFVENLIDDSENKCYYCQCELQFVEYTETLATIERLDNSKGHIKGNCVIACRTCNVSKVGDKK